jgi:uncharacterized short protein YbdD (DUF466 family)
MRLLRTWLKALRTVIGVPDYERYLRHMARAHPHAPVLTAAEFSRARHAARYDKPGSRCC